MGEFRKEKEKTGMDEMKNHCLVSRLFLATSGSAGTKSAHNLHLQLFSKYLILYTEIRTTIEESMRELSLLASGMLLSSTRLITYVYPLLPRKDKNEEY